MSTFWQVATVMHGLALGLGAWFALDPATATAEEFLRKTLPADETGAWADGFEWRGGYAGIEAGGGWGTSRQSFSAPAPPGDSNPSGGAVGAFAGYNLRYHRFVTGLEADVAATDIAGSFANAGNIPSFGNTRLGWEGALRARFGFAMDHALIYAAGGVVLADTHIGGGTAIVPGSVCCGFTKLRAGYTIGLGAEYAINAALVGRVEYRLNGFGVARGILAPAEPGVALRTATAISEVRFGLAYKFGN